MPATVTSQRTLHPLITPTKTHTVGILSSAAVVFPVSWMTAAPSATATRSPRVRASPCRPRRTASIDQATTCPSEVEKTIQRRIPTWACRSVPWPRL